MDLHTGVVGFKPSQLNLHEIVIAHYEGFSCLVIDQSHISKLKMVFIWTHVHISTYVCCTVVLHTIVLYRVFDNASNLVVNDCSTLHTRKSPSQHEARAML